MGKKEKSDLAASMRLDDDGAPIAEDSVNADPEAESTVTNL